jgi:hypothetical protein
MVLALDYVGIATIVSATAAAIVSIVVALRQTTTKAQTNEIHAAVSTSNGHTLGEVIESTARAVEADVVPPTKPPKP